MSTDSPDMVPEGGGLFEFDILGMLNRRKWTGLLMLVLGVAAGYYYFDNTLPMYQSTARIMIFEEDPQRRDEDDLPIQGIDDRTGFEGDLTSQIFLLKSPRILQAAVDSAALQECPTILRINDPVRWLSGALDIYQPRLERGGAAQNILELKINSRIPEDCPTILDAVIASYQDFVDTSREGVSKESLATLMQQKHKLDGELQTKRDAYREFRADAPILISEQGRLNHYIEEIKKIQEALNQLKIDRSQKEGRLAAIEAAFDSDDSTQALLLMIKTRTGARPEEEEAPPLLAVTPSAGEKSLEEILFPMRQEEQKLLQRIGTDHPDYLAHQRLMMFAEKHYLELQQRTAQQPDPNAEDVESDPEEAAREFIATYIQSLKQELAADQEEEALLNDQLANNDKIAREQQNTELQDDEFRRDLEATQRLFDSIVQRITELNLIDDQGKKHSEVIVPAKLGDQVAPDLVKSLAVGGAGGLLLGLILMYLREAADSRYRNPDDIRRHLRVPVLAHIPYAGAARKKKGYERFEREMVAVHDPASMAAEAVRALRTSIMHEMRMNNAKVLQVNSPDPRDGKTTMACNLAVSFAQAGKRTVIVDTDLRRARMHKAFGSEREPGISDVVRGASELTDVISASGIENLSLLSAGRPTSKPAELLTSLKFEQMIEQLRDLYDVVIVDCPPLLAVTDPGVVAGLTDVSLLVMTLDKQTRQRAEAALQHLRSVRANVLGIVVNARNRKRNPGYMGKYYGGSYYSHKYSRQYRDAANIPEEELIGV